jgi:ubiquinone/menaquinone biosynthesis C-methylase UbiE
MDPLAGTPWSAPSMVEGFSRGQPNRVLMQYAPVVKGEGGSAVAVDIGCGAGRNAVPLARAGWRVVGTDLSQPMLTAAHARVIAEGLPGRFLPMLAPMERLPVRDRTADLIVAHGIWNLAKSDAEFRRAVREAARVAKLGGARFVFTFSRHTLPAAAVPVSGQRFTFTQFSGEPQIFLTDTQLCEEMAAAGFTPDAAVPVSEYNRPAGAVRQAGPPVIYEAAFRFTG